MSLSKKNRLKIAFHHFTSRVIFLFAILIVVAAVALTALRASTPLLDHNRSTIQNWVTKLIHRPVTIGEIKAGWHGFEPVIQMENVTLFSSQSHQPLIKLNSFSIGFNLWQTLLTRHFKIGLIVVKGTALNITENKDRTITIASNIDQTIEVIHPHHKGIGKLLPELFSINKFYVENINVTWHRSNGVVLPIQHIKMEVVNRDGAHHIWGMASLHQVVPTKFSFVAHIKGTIGDRSSLHGTAYFHGQHINLKQWLSQKEFFGIDHINGDAYAKVWTHWNAGALTQLQAQIGINRLSVRESVSAPKIKEKTKIAQKTIFLSNLKGNLLWKRQSDGWLLTGDKIVMQAGGHQYPTSQFSFQKTDNGLLASVNSPQSPRYKFFINYVPLRLISPILNHINAVLTTKLNIQVGDNRYTQFRKQWAMLNPQGLLNNIYGEYQSKQDFSFHTFLKNIKLERANHISAINSVDGELFVYPHYGTLNLKSSDFYFDEPRLFQHSIHLNKLQGDILWRRDTAGWNVTLSKINLANQDLNVYGRTTLFFPDTNRENPTISLLLNSDYIDLRKVKNYLPVMSSHHRKLNRWLSTAFLGGDATHSTLVIQGALKDLSFKHQKGIEKNGIHKNAIFHSEIDLRNVKLEYKPGWPPLNNLKGTLIFSGKKLVVNIHFGKTFGTQIKSAIAIIPDLGKKIGEELNVHGVIDGDLSNGLRFLEQSPLKKHIGRHLTELKMNGPMHLVLDLKIPLKHDDDNDNPTYINSLNKRLKKKHHQDDDDETDVIAKGTVTVTNGMLKVPSWHFSLSDINGNLDFSNHTLFGRDISAKFLGQPTRLNVTTLSQEATHSITQIELSAPISISELYNQYHLAPLKPLLGTTNLDAVLQLRDSHSGKNSLVITTPLVGVSVPYPKPFYKLAHQKREIEIRTYFQDKAPVITMIRYGKKVKAALTLNKDKEGLHFVNGNLHFGSGLAKFQTKNGLFIDGSLSTIRWNDWKSWIIPKTQTKNSSFKKNRKKKEDFWLENFRALSLKLDQLTLLGHHFSKTRVMLHLIKKQWRVGFNGLDIDGSILLPNHQHKILIGHFEKLYLKKSLAKKSATKKQLKADPKLASSTDIKPQQLPPLDFKIGDFRYGSLRLGHLVLMTTPTNEGLTINKLMASSHIFKLDTAGVWQNYNGKVTSGLTGEFDASSLGAILAEMNYPSTLDAKNIQSHFSFEWSGAPFDPNIRTLKGHLSFHTGEGVITKMSHQANEGIATGQLLTILSLQSLQRRLTLNFNDLKQKGFSFDSFKGDFHIKNGDSWTTNSYINGVVAGINMHGHIGLKQKDFDLYLDITPHLTSSLPLIATIAGGPIVGAATYVANKLFSPILNRIAIQYYHLTGPWEKPKVVHLNSKKGSVKGMKIPGVGNYKFP